MTATTRPKQTDDGVRIMRALNNKIRSGKAFTTDSIWPRLKGVDPDTHKEWVGQQVQKWAEAGRIRQVDWVLSQRSRPKNRPVPLWEGVPDSERRPA